jgi:hypothetical protein
LFLKYLEFFHEIEAPRCHYHRHFRSNFDLSVEALAATRRLTCSPATRPGAPPPTSASTLRSSRILSSSNAPGKENAELICEIVHQMPAAEIRTTVSGGRIARTYHELLDAIAVRLVELNVQQLELDERCGLGAGHTGKILGPKPTKRYGPMSFDLHRKARGHGQRPHGSRFASLLESVGGRKATRVEVRLPSAQRLELARLAEATGVSAADLVRYGIHMFLNQSRPTP